MFSKIVGGDDAEEDDGSSSGRCLFVLSLVDRLLEELLFRRRFRLGLCRGMGRQGCDIMQAIDGSVPQLAMEVE